MSEKFDTRVIGTSRDYRTNRWSVTCKKCNKTTDPETTMLSTQVVECKCGETELINWNEELANL